MKRRDVIVQLAPGGAAGVAAEGAECQTEAAEADPPEGRGRLPAPILILDIIDETDAAADGDGWAAIAGLEPALHAVAATLAACAGLGPEPCAAAVALADDATVQRLNASYRGFDKPTNVLSFPAGGPQAGVEEGEPRALGDIILARETVLREADALAIAPLHHVQHLVAHGLLHLLGYDHMTDEDAAVMEGLETRILAQLGIADPYAHDGTAAADGPGGSV